MEKNPTLHVVAAALVDVNGLVLLQQRAPGRQMAGLWEFPGGKVEKGEGPETALVRELREELGIDCKEDSFVPVGFASEPLGDRHLLLLLFTCREWRGVPQPLDASALRWVRPLKMLELPMPPADRPLIAPLAASINA